MATEQTALPVNGNYASQDPHPAGASGEHTNHDPRADVTSTAGPAPDTFGSQNANVPSSAGTASGDDAHSDVPKHEVGWYFVKQYYTNLSRSPDKWHLFYHKKSQLVFGVEAEKIQVSVGRTAIAERIKELDFQDCKVRVSNVDCQASFDNIVIQVIGEISNKSAPHRKFVQTFVLAQQPNGYYVLNDIFRYINEEDEEEPDVEVYHEGGPNQATERQEEPPQSQDGPKTLTDSEDPAQQERDIEQVDAELEEVISKQDEDAQHEPETAAQAPMPNGASTNEVAEDQEAKEDPQEVKLAEQEDNAAPAETPKPDDVSEEPQPEQPKEPEPTPTASPPQSTPSVATQGPSATQPKFAAPKTWANMVAGSRSTPSATTPSPGSSTSPAPSQPRVAPPPVDTPEPSPSPVQQGPNAGWQTAGNDHARRQSRPQSSSDVGERDKVLAYVKNVTEKVNPQVLRETLLQYGELAYFDISRQRNCAFVEFSTPAGYQAAVAANPHLIGGEQIYVEERRPRSGAYGSGGFNANRGGPGRGRVGPDGRLGHQGRGGFQKDGGRGNYGPSRGRGGNMSPRGRGGNQNG